MEIQHMKLDTQQNKGNNQNGKVYFWINPGSGENKGNQLLQLGFKKIAFQNYSTYFVNLRDDESVKFFADKIKTHILNKQWILIVSCGGDGTLSWVIERLCNNEVSIQELLFTSLPYGSGNDICFYLNTQAVDFSIEGLQKFLQTLNKMKESILDIWTIKMKADDNGNIMKYTHNPNTQEIILGKEVKCKMINYFGIGSDALIGYSYEPHRTKSKMCNQIWHCIFGTKLNCLCKSQRISYFVDKFKQVNQNIESVIFQNKPSVDGINLLALNINSYSAGTRNVWNNSMHRQITQFGQSKMQQASDGLLEFVTFSNIANIGLEKLLKGRAYQIAQGEQFEVEFLKGICTYFHVDGEYYKIDKPVRAKILKEGSSSIRVLKN